MIILIVLIVLYASALCAWLFMFRRSETFIAPPEVDSGFQRRATYSGGSVFVYPRLEAEDRPLRFADIPPRIRQRNFASAVSAIALRDLAARGHDEMRRRDFVEPIGPPTRARRRGKEK